MTSLRSSIAGFASLLAAWGFGAARADPRDPKSDSFLSDAGKTSLPLAAAARGGSVPSLASLVANGCFLTLCVIRIHNTNRPFLDRTRIFSNFYSITQIVFLLRSSLRQAFKTCPHAALTVHTPTDRLPPCRRWRQVSNLSLCCHHATILFRIFFRRRKWLLLKSVGWKKSTNIDEQGGMLNEP